MELTHKEFIERIKSVHFQKLPKLLKGMLAEYCMVEDIDLDTSRWDYLIYEIWNELGNVLIQIYIDKEDFEFDMSEIFS